MSLSVEILQERKNQYVRKKNTAQKEVNEINDAYESLLLFKGKVNTADSNFDGVRGAEKALLARITPYKGVNACAKTYVETVSDFLDSIGVTIINIAFSALIRMIDSRLKRYKEKSKALLEDIMGYGRKIEELEREIKVQMAMEGSA